MNISDIIGHTPILRLDRISSLLESNLFMKLEIQNPTGSASDRTAFAYVEDALNSGKLMPYGCMVDAVDEYMACSLAMAGIHHDIRLIVCMPSCSPCTAAMLSELGVEIILSHSTHSMAASIKKAECYHKDIWNSYSAKPFSHPLGPKTHYEQTGRELVEDLVKSSIIPDYFIAAIGTGAFFTGVGKRLKEKFPNISLIAVEPENSAVLSGRSICHYGVCGMGFGFIPPILEQNLISEVITVSEKDARSSMRRLHVMEAVLAGPVSGAVLNAAVKLAQRKEVKGKNIIIAATDPWRISC